MGIHARRFALTEDPTFYMGHWYQMQVKLVADSLRDETRRNYQRGSLVDNEQFRAFLGSRCVWITFVVRNLVTRTLLQDKSPPIL